MSELFLDFAEGVVWIINTMHSVFIYLHKLYKCTIFHIVIYEMLFKMNSFWCIIVAELSDINVNIVSLSLTGFSVTDCTVMHNHTSFKVHPFIIHSFWTIYALLLAHIHTMNQFIFLYFSMFRRACAPVRLSIHDFILSDLLAICFCSFSLEGDAELSVITAQIGKIK